MFINNEFIYLIKLLKKMCNNNMNKIIIKDNLDEINDINRCLDNFLLKFIKHDIKLDKNDYKQLCNNHINKQFIKNRIHKIISYIKQLNKLKEYPLIEQRTKEWYELRNTCLTASDLYDGINSNSLLLAKKKAGVYIDDTNFNHIKAIKWGTMFEDMAIRCYSQLNNNINIYEFGLITNNNISNFGASPDGITELGIMIEIKCPYKRILKKDYVPEKYYYQIQGQLAVCELEECDYVECYFKTYETDEEYINEVKEKQFTNTNHGIIAEYLDKINDCYYYIYSDKNLTTEECIENINNKILNFNKENFVFQTKTRWVLDNIYIQKIKYNINFWENIPEKIKLFWNKVIECKSLPIEYKNKKKLEFIKDE
tara:strand:+ start:16352 stop:17458 length:1107 start_codon:yes stop_codon:yes gene_type:complete